MQDLGETIKAGATTVNLGDTVGINMPQETRDLVSYLKANTPGIDDVVISVHCHNDLGVATANAIAVLKSILLLFHSSTHIYSNTIEQLVYIFYVGYMCWSKTSWRNGQRNRWEKWECSTWRGEFHRDRLEKHVGVLQFF